MMPDSSQTFGVALMLLWGAAGAVAAGRAAARSPAMKELAAAVRKMNLAAKGALVAGLVCAVAVGGTKPAGNDPQRLGPRPLAATRTVATTNTPPFALVEIRTNDVSLAAPTSDAVVSEAIRRHGTSEGGEWIETDAPFFLWGTNPVSRVFASPAVLSFGTMRHPALGASLPDGSPAESLVALRTPLGLAPEANWPSLPAPSRFWHETTPLGRMFTWENALLDRQSDSPATVQIETWDDGDFVFRYDFASASPTNEFLVGAQLGPAAVDALSVRGGGVTNAATVWRVDGAPVPAGASVADLFGVSRLELRWKNVADFGDLSGDTDGDGLSDWDEIFRHGTDPAQTDTDGDGLSDGSEILSGADPLDADEDADGIPDGMSPSGWAGNPLWAEVSGETNLVITLAADISADFSATLVLGPLSLPLRQARTFPLCIQPGQCLDFRLFSTASRPIPLSIETGGTQNRKRSAPPRRSLPVPVFAPAPLWAEDPAGVFDEEARRGEGRLAHPVLRLDQDDREPGECIHNDDPTHSRTWTVSILPAETGLSAADLMLEGFQTAGPDKISLFVDFEPDAFATGTASLTLPKLRIGALSETRSIHRCRGYRNGPRCLACGRFHRPGSFCSHAADCAAVLDPAADCTCQGVYVHVAWQDADGNGTEDRKDAHLVAGPDAVVFTGLDGDADGCCCWDVWENLLPATARLRFHSDNLRIFDAAGTLMSAGSTGTVFTIQAKDVSPRVRGSQIEYQLLDRTNGVLRTFHVPVTAWDLWDTGLSFNWATNAHSSDAINLRHDYATPIDYAQPEWSKARDHAASPTRNEPACWIAGTRPTVKARFAILPADISNAVLNAASAGPILSTIDDTAVSFSNGVTRALVGTNAVPFAPFSLASDITNIVSRSTNEVWHWYASSVNNHPFAAPVSVATNGPGVAYSILDEPVAPWTDSSLTNQNVWVSALDFLTPTNVCGDATSKTNALARLTQFLFDGHHLRYDRSWGDCKYFHFPDASIPGSHHWFDVSDYMVRNKGSVVNCYDQAYAVSLFGKLSGIESDVVFLQPFGFINETGLVGVGRCNSPFYTSGPLATATVRGSNDTTRAWFLNHRYVIRDNMIFDACVGPALGTQTHQQYLDHSVDTSTPDERDLTDFQSDYRVHGKKAGDIGNKEIDSFPMEIQ